MAVTIDILDLATPDLMRMAVLLSPGRMNPTIGEAAANCVRAHLFKLDVERPNQLGGKRTHFYSQAAKTTSYQLMPDGAVVSVAQVGMAQRYYGGEIKPDTKKALTIPACAEAHGMRASEFDLHPIRFKRQDGKTMGALADASGKVYYWLVKSVTQQPDPSVLPTNDEMRSRILSGVQDYLAGV